MKLFYIRHTPTKANVSGDIIKDYDSYDILDFDRDEWMKKVGCHLPKYDARNRWTNALIEIVRRRGPVDKDAVIIGHGFYGRLVRSIYNNDDDTPFQILNSTNFEFKNLDMMEIEHCEVQRVFRS